MNWLFPRSPCSRGSPACSPNACVGTAVPTCCGTNASSSASWPTRCSTATGGSTSSWNASIPRGAAGRSTTWNVSGFEHDSHEVARHLLPVHHAECRLLRGADVLSEGTPCPEPTPAGDVARVGWFPLDGQPVAHARRSDAWHGREQRARVGMTRSREQIGRPSHLHDLAEIHDRNALT